MCHRNILDRLESNYRSQPILVSYNVLLFIADPENINILVHKGLEQCWILTLLTKGTHMYKQIQKDNLSLYIYWYKFIVVSWKKNTNKFRTRCYVTHKYFLLDCILLYLFSKWFRSWHSAVKPAAEANINMLANSHNNIFRTIQLVPQV